MEIERLRQVADAHSHSTVQEVQEVQRQMEASTRELEAHKSKRLTARSEMIGLAQTLERAQTEGEELRQFLQYSLSPIVFDQISGIEALLTNLEATSSQLASKRSVRLQTQASDFMGRRLRSEKNGIHGDHDLVDGNDPNSLSSSGSSNTSNSSMVSLAGNSRNLGGSKGSNGNNGSGNGRYVGGSAASLASLGEAMTQAETLRRELERAQAGVMLLGQAMERLTDVVRQDSRCCGGLTDIMRELVGASPVSSALGRATGRHPAGGNSGYAVLGRNSPGASLSSSSSSSSVFNKLTKSAKGNFSIDGDEDKWRALIVFSSSLHFLTLLLFSIYTNNTHIFLLSFFFPCLKLKAIFYFFYSIAL